MVDFNKLKQTQKQNSVVDPQEIFRRLPKPPGINDLYSSQSEVLSQWYDRRREKDLVMKLHTGGGKTLVGLLLAQSCINELQEPCLYLCSTSQLVEQTMIKANEYGIPVTTYVKGAPLDKDYTSARRIMVCTYNALFNSKSKFGGPSSSAEPIVNGSIVLDDAHIAFSTMRDVFTLSVQKEVFPEEYDYLTNLFRRTFIEHQRGGTYDDILAGNEYKVVEVPYWSWKEKTPEVREYLQDRSQKFVFEWGFLRDAFDYSHCLISSRGFSITPIFPTTDQIPSFEKSKRRIYMSATINDDSSLIRTFDADPECLRRPIVSNSLAGVSERMILVPELMPKKISDEIGLTKSIVNKLKQEDKSSVILVPSKVEAKKWDDVATIADSVEKVGQFVKELQDQTQTSAYVFVNRYDGIDLPNDACRLLVMAGAPKGSNDYDLYRSSVFFGGHEAKSSHAQRIEQGIGRAARGSGDFCVVILLGSDLVSWIDSQINRKYLTSSTQAQLTIGYDVSSAIESNIEFVQTLQGCLSRDPQWTRYHAESLAELVQPSVPDEDHLKAAAVERKAFNLMRRGEFDAAMKRISNFVETESEADRQAKGWLLQLAARIALYAENLELSTQFQTQAFISNDKLFRPAKGDLYVPITSPQAQSKAIVKRIRQFASAKGAIADLNSHSAMLTSSASAGQFENALEQLGKILGFSTQRPDNTFAVGPDVLWLLNDISALVIEAKSKKESYNPLTKDEHGQLLSAVEWFKQKYPTFSSTRVSVHPNKLSTASTVTNETRVMTLESLRSLVSNTSKLLDLLDEPTLSPEQLEQKCETLLDELHLSPSKLSETFLDYFEVTGLT